MKRFIYGIFAFLQSIIMWLPFYYLRLLWCKIFLRKCGKNVFISRRVDLRSPWKGKIGNNVVINKRCVLDMRGHLTIGNNVDIAQDVQIWTAEHDVHGTDHKMISSPVVICDNVWLSSRSTVLPGVTIHEGAVVASGAVVTKDVEPFSIVGGIPAKKIGERNKNLNYKLNYKPFFE